MQEIVRHRLASLSTRPLPSAALASRTLRHASSFPLHLKPAHTFVAKDNVRDIVW